MGVLGRFSGPQIGENLTPKKNVRYVYGRGEHQHSHSKYTDINAQQV